MEKYLCIYCKHALVKTDENGNKVWGEHAKDCPAKLPPSKPKSGRDAAVSRLACGSFCRGKEGYLSDLGGISVCGKCPHHDLVIEGVESQYKGKRARKPVEVIYKPLPKTSSNANDSPIDRGQFSDE